MPGKLFTLSLQKKLVSTRCVPHQPLLLQAWHPACISGVRALGECDNCQNGCVMFALYFEAATAAAAAPGLPRLEEGGRQLHNNDVLYNKQGVCRPFILSVALDDVVDAAKLITQH